MKYLFKIFESEPWHLTKKEFLGPSSTSEDEEEFLQDARSRREKQRLWDSSIRRAIATGQITFEEARDRGYWFSDEEWKPLPQRLFHVTTALSAVMKEGLKTRQELKIDSGTGLGGGPDDFISFTDDAVTAETIASTFLFTKKALSGEIRVQTLIDHAKKGIGAKAPFYDDWKDGLGSEWYRVEGLLWDKEIKNFDRRRWEQSSEGWTVVNDSSPFQVIASRPFTPETKSAYMMFILRYWFASRQEAGGQEDPLFFMADSSKWISLDSKEIGIIECRPASPEFLGIKVGSLHEWRVPFGDLVKITGTIPIQETHLIFNKLRTVMTG